ncbi:uncharacterized protein PV09_02517 [Verruconis gallopava]|uniref:U1-type domain-containing protein n=1 Tax=Verruconis gallopava TaxID=253628 RepID=A0A0D1Z1M7_9PEZI|nr:uncharacterized protein PV09_02517 [Verruconis gallopava]KIW06837.1 hypothetical protein PV09_02517 [Verruconis gallopava]
MAEYWKSTPKYWCKFCKVFVKDTKLERQQHDATPRHQGNIQKSLRGLHKEKEQEERQKQRAKDEVARLNGVVGGGSSSTSNSTTAPSKASGFKEAPRQATLEERKRQMQQLADMGVAIPEEFRREMAMAGDWQTIKVTRIEQAKPKENGSEDTKEGVAFGIRKRRFEDQEEEEAILGTGDAAAPRKNRNWGNRMKAFPGSKKVDDEDIDALLGSVTVKRDLKKEADEADDASATVAADPKGVKVEVTEEKKTEMPELKKSESNEELEAAAKLQAASAPEDTSAKAINTPGTGIVFKKRKKIVK